MDFDPERIAAMLHERANVALECMVALGVIADAEPDTSAETLRHFARHTLDNLPPSHEPDQWPSEPS